MAEKPKEVLAFDSTSKGKFNKTPFKRHEKPETGKCRYCGGKQKRSRSGCPAYRKTCASCGKLNHFASICTQGMIEVSQELSYRRRQYTSYRARRQATRVNQLQPFH